MYSKRVEKLVANFGALGVDSLLVMPSHGMNLTPNIYYLTGFTGSTAYLLITQNERLFLTDSRYIEGAGKTISHFEIVDTTGKKLDEQLKELTSVLGTKRLGIEASQMPVATFNKYTKVLAPIEIVPTVNAVEKLRMIKDESEVSLLRESIRINEESLKDVLGFVRDGVTERDLEAEFEYILRKRGGDMVSFSPIIASGKNSSKPHAGYTDQVLVPEAPITFDVGVIYKGYCSDMTRTVFFKDCPEIWKQRYDAVFEAKWAAERMISAGLTGAEIDAVARNIILEAGFGEHVYTHGLGHSIGIEVHEKPVFAMGAENVIPAGCVMSVEPGIYVPGEGGIRIEDLVLVTSNGVEKLNNLECDLVVVG